jgi:hypothetical protein
MTEIEKLLKEMDDRAEIGQRIMDEEFDNRELKGYAHLPNFKEDFKAIIELLPNQTIK